MLLTGLLLLEAGAAAQQQGLTVMAEPDPYTDVLDAFDGDDPLDLRVSLGFHTDITSATIQREAAATADGGLERIDIADAELVVKTLRLSVEVGVYQDLSLSFALPFVMESQQQWTPVASAGAARAAIDEALQEPWAGGTGAVIDLGQGFASRLRDGIPHLEFGVAWSPVNQFRHGGWPTWTLRWDNRLGTGAAMAPCLRGEDCTRGPGRGTWRTRVSTRFSYRYLLVEPVIGFSHAIEVPTVASDRFKPSGDLGGDLSTAPPSTTAVTGGATLIAWEDRGAHQRLSLSALVSGSYVSAGRNYGFLFDALGRSSHPQLSGLEPEDASQSETPAFSGLTRTGSHMRLLLRLELLMQAARHVRFAAGVGLGRVTPHSLTGEPACRDRAQSAGPGCPGGAFNPLYRAAIDRDGGRFHQRTASLLQLFARASGQF